MLSPEELYLINVQWCNGVAPGYWPTAASSSSLVLDLSAGTSFLGNVRCAYAGGTLTLTDNATNYVFLDTTASNAPAFNTTGYPSTGIPIATVVTASGAITTIQDDRTPFQFSGAASIPYAITFDMGGGRTQVPATSESLLRHVIPANLSAVSLPSGLTGSVAKCRTNSTGTYTITINKNGSSVGTITFSAANPTASFTFSSAVSFSPGDILELMGGTADATILGIYITLSGTRT